MNGKKVAVGIVVGVVVVIGLIMFAVFAFFANNPTQQITEGPNEFTGQVIALEDERVLVVSGTDEELEGLTGEAVVDSGLPAIWFTVTIDQRDMIRVGDTVRVTHNQVAESYPGQSTAVTIEKQE
ncbi:DUF3221 domain-containing protein [Chryseomicrobium aureum]|uniref:DUF3221 domain-containing protein n=1 Tax=Chryseomicrobium aureum TaxID=1441723 RepID=UPI00195E26F9|nr:DUF3221 domain-containing protein [Chryseomicrobium aureum]MBM7706472.1 hypothetical protein [Chryseomicrobium aureum]